ncbi:hypothetical protein GGF42_003189 [Coemansia sp. RSA 2424]|nr:hypothetical protein GGF42_003189 [Coemansia sp. RSA 2424]
MPRPTRKAAAKPKVAVATATTETTKGTTAAEKENVKDELPKKSPTSNKRRLRSQSTAADSGIEDDGIEASPPSKRMATEAVSASPGKSPKIVTPRYGRRISSGGGVGRYQRRLTFDTDVGRRTSGASDLVFDGLLDGFSPIKRNAPPETLDFDDDGEDLPQADDVVMAMLPQKQQPPPSVAVESKEEDEEKVASADDDESDSELFDIDALLVAGRHRNRSAHKPKSAGSGGVAARIMASSSLGDASVVDLLGQDSTAGDLLPRRTRTTRSHAPKPEAASTKPARGRTTASRARKPAANKEDQSSSSEEDENEDAGDSWKPSKAAATTTPTRKPRKAAATSTTTAKRSATTAAAAAAASNRAASSSRASAKTKDSKPAAAAASAWGVDSKTAKYFDDIDGFELTEEAV